ncbi:MAG: PIN domain-containing protein [Oscillibacter sp.]|nr:PIN domain-containing protein [Oscillibacter sp.]
MPIRTCGSGRARDLPGLWRKNTVRLIDANVILRYLLREPEEMAEKAKEVIDAGAYTTMEVMAEVVYVLQKVYHAERKEISSAVSTFLNEIAIENADVLRYALEIFSVRGLDFVDCVLAARAVLRQDNVFSFDKKLMRFIRETAPAQKTDG